MRPDEGQLSVELAVLRHIYVCSDMDMNLSRCKWFIKVSIDCIEAHIVRLMQTALVAAIYSLVRVLMKAN